MPTFLLHSDRLCIYFVKMSFSPIKCTKPIQNEEIIPKPSISKMQMIINTYYVIYLLNILL